jgi:predicted PurR-regulated permease PerM
VAAARRTGTHRTGAKVAPYAGNLTRWFVSEIGSFGLVFVQFLLTVALSAVLYASGEKAAAGVRRFGYRLSGERGESAVVLAGQAARAVALGVGVTAIVQSLLGGIGLAIAGVPFAPVLTAVMFMFCIAQLGPTLVLAPAVVWLYWGDNTGWGTFLLVWTVFVGTMDNFLRPILIRQGADLPLLLILAGVIGGMLAFGLVGISSSARSSWPSATPCSNGMDQRGPPEVGEGAFAGRRAAESGRGGRPPDARPGRAGRSGTQTPR